MNDLSSVPEIDAHSVPAWDLLLQIMAVASIMVLVLGGISVLLFTV